MEEASVSVVIPTYNRAHCLGATLDAILAQTRLPDEILVSNDGSNDDTEALVTFYAERSVVPIRYLRQANAGVSAARNRAIARARGEWIALCDSDDLWKPEKLELQLLHAAAHPGLDLIFADMEVRYWDRPHVSHFLSRYQVKPLLQANPGNLRNMHLHMLRESFIPVSTVMIRKSAMAWAGLFDEQFDCIEDREYWIRLAAKGTLGFVDQVLLTKVEHGDDNLGRQRLPRSHGLLKIADRFEQRFGQDLDRTTARELRALRCRAHQIALAVQIEAGDHAEALRHWRQAWSAAPIVSKQRLQLLRRTLDLSASALSHRVTLPATAA